MEIENYIEFETKYEVTWDQLLQFKQHVEKMDYKKFIYVEGTDIFFTKGNREDFFARFRNPSHSKEAWFTVKEKKKERDNINRTEVNWDVSGTSQEEVVAGAKLMGFEYNRQLWKSAHIYQFSDFNLVFYTVQPEENKFDHFIEIEVNEDKSFTEEECWDIIRRNEDILSPLGITAQKRKRKSLFEMYKK